MWLQSGSLSMSESLPIKMNAHWSRCSFPDLLYESNRTISVICLSTISNIILPLFFLFMLLLCFCSQVLVRPTETAWTVLLQDSRFSIFVKFAKIAGLESVLRTDNVTVFAPENLIFHHFDRDDFQKLVNNRRYLRDFMRYHIAKGRGRSWYSFEGYRYGRH